MATRTLSNTPRILPLYARAAAAMIPGASHLPLVPGRGGEVPDVDLELLGVRAEPDTLAAYAELCAFAPAEHLPVTYPHVLAFPLHMAVLADGRFPFAAAGLVHVRNRILQHRRIALAEELALRVRPTPLQPHTHGTTFTLATEARVDGVKVWEGLSTFLRRGGSDGAGATRREVDSEADLAFTTAWHLDGDLGRRYAAISGDRNPIHTHTLAAKSLGFPGAIAHGMWTKARALAELAGHLPETFGVEVSFQKPAVLPTVLQFSHLAKEAQIEFAVRDAERGTPHLNGRVWPIERTAATETAQ